MIIPMQPISCSTMRRITITPIHWGGQEEAQVEGQDMFYHLDI